MLRRKNLVSVLLVVMLIASLVSGCAQEQEVVKEMELTVTTAKAITMDIAKSVKLSGMTKGKDEVYIIAKAAGQVTGVLVKPGQAVSQGQTIITLDSSDYQAAVQQAEAALRLAEINLETAITNLERMEKLYEAGAISTQQLEAAQTGVNSAQAGVEQATAAFNMAQTQINICNITSPISGIIGSINVSVGDMASPSSPVAVVSNTSQLEIEVLASETDINYITEGEEAEVLIKAVSDESFKGYVETVAVVPDPMKRSYSVKITLPNEEGIIKSGMFAEVNIATESKKGALCVPASALVLKGNQTVIFTVDEENRAR
ncbi:MAG: efflux RND transporter periplasmic adaptor subunit, partial [Syntrophomonadaceae bacterium]|nr:efflux RND transporter periplasmic adaptor subunit [Syntrophomonadaceae bacterium]